MGEKKKTLHNDILIMSIEFIIKFIKKFQNLVTLMSSIAFNYSFRVKTIFIRFVNKV